MNLRHIVAALLIATPCSLRAGVADDLTLTAAGVDYPLITTGAGEKSLRVTLSSSGVPAADARIRMIKAEVRGYNGYVERTPKVLSTTQTSLSLEEGVKRDVTVKVDLSQLGLYEITLSAVDAAGQSVATTQVAYGVIPPRTTTGPSDFGICAHIAGGGAEKIGVIEKSLDLIKLAGFSGVRNDFFWNQIERQVGVYSFAPGHDAFVKLAAERGLSPLIILAYGNGAVYSMKTGFPDEPESRAAFARYASELAKRYGETVKHWEVWNEPQAWGKPTVETYTLLLKETYDAIKEASPSAYVISCGGGGAGGGPSGDYLGGVIKAGGLEYQDGFSIHPYISPPGTPDMGYLALNSVIPRVSIPTVWKHLGRFLADERKHKANGKGLDMWVTEFGCYSSPVAWVKGEPFQAAFLTRSYLLSRKHGTAKAIFWYDFQDDGTNPQSIEHNFGLIRKDFSPKPSYIAASVLTWTLGDRPWTATLVENDDTHVVQYGDGNDAVVAGWLVKQMVSEFVMVKLKAGTYILRDWQGVDKEVEVDEKGYRWKLGPMPQYLLPKPTAL